VPVQTFTYTWTHTRLETIQDQFRYFMTYGNVDESKVDKVVYAVGEKAVQAVGLFGCDASGLRVIEAELRVDWDLSAELTLSIPNINSPTGWLGTQAPEIKVAGRRFAQTAERLQLDIRFWVLFTPAVRNDATNHEAWCKHVGVLFGSVPPGWKVPPEDRAETLLDLPEVQVTMRRARE
jgi:hypothetical protein